MSDDRVAESADAFYGAVEEQDGAPLGGATQQQRARKATNAPGDRDLGGVAGGALQAPEDRLLEYSITLTYRTEDYRAARQQLIELAGKYGYIMNSYASTEPAWSMNTTMRVRAAEMYLALKELDALGELESEQINSTDHTESMVLASRQFRRERLRLARRNAAANQTPAANKSWAEREQLIEQSENRQDQAEHEQWKINDRVSFAQIEVRLLGPDLPVQIDVPPYQNAFVILLNGMLHLLYAMILGLPLLLIFALLWLKRGAIKRALGVKSPEQ